MPSPSALLRDDQRELHPLEAAINRLEPGIQQPVELLAEARETVGRIVLWPADRLAETLVLLHGCRGDEIEIDEHTAGNEQRMDLAEQRTLALMLEMVDRKRGDDHIDRRLLAQRLGEVVVEELDEGIVGETLSGAIEHRRREVETDRDRARMVLSNERDQPPIACSQVDETFNLLGQRVEQHPFRDVAMRDLP